MPETLIVYWRDIPAQVIVGKGRRAAKVQLPERFEQAIDRAAMAGGLASTDAYLEQWRKAPGPEVAGTDRGAAETLAAELDGAYDTDRLKALISGHGWAGQTQMEDP